MRMHVRRQLALLLAVVMVLCMSLTAVAADGAAPVSLQLAEGTAYNKGTVQIQVMADEDDVAADGTLTVTYDAQMLHYDATELGSVWPEDSYVRMRVNDTEEGKLVIAFAGVHEAKKGDLFNLFFTALQEDTTVVKMDGYISGAAGEVSGEVAIEALCPSAQFEDVNPASWMHEGVDYAVAKGYMVGVSDTLFAPKLNTNRATMVTVLYRLAGCPNVEGLENPFTDVKAGAWYEDAVLWAYSKGVTEGLSATTFGPKVDMTREQMAAFFYRFAKYMGCNVDVKGDLSVFDDVSTVHAWAAESMSWAVGSGLMSGVGNNLLAPRQYTNRAQVATVLMNFDLKILN